MKKKLLKLKSVKLDKIVEFLSTLKDKEQEIEIKFEEPKEFKRE